MGLVLSDEEKDGFMKSTSNINQTNGVFQEEEPLHMIQTEQTPLKGTTQRFAHYKRLQTDKNESNILKLVNMDNKIHLTSDLESQMFFDDDDSIEEKEQKSVVKTNQNTNRKIGN